MHSQVLQYLREESEHKIQDQQILQAWDMKGGDFERTVALLKKWVNNNAFQAKGDDPKSEGGKC